MAPLRAALAAAALALARAAVAVPVHAVQAARAGRAASLAGNASQVGGNASDGRGALRGRKHRRGGQAGQYSPLVAEDTVWGDVDPGRLRLLELNTWHEGTAVLGGFDMIVEVIAASAADVVVLSEVRNANGMFHERLQAALAVKGQIFKAGYHSGDVAMLSRWPIVRVDVPYYNVAAYHIAATRPVVVCTAHLDHHHYASAMPRGYDANVYFAGPQYKELEKPVTDVERLHAEDEVSTRGPALKAFLAYAASLDAPVVLAGDFNECSHLDWTAETAHLFDHNGVEIEWRNSRILCDAGFLDSWRELHPSPATHPGFTWPSEARGYGNTGWAPKADERDRIDFIYHNGRGIAAAQAWLVGSPQYYVRGALRVDDPDLQCPILPSARDLPWPSDHKGLLVEFSIAGHKTLDHREWPPQMGGIEPGNMSLGSLPRHNASVHL